MALKFHPKMTASVFGGALATIVITELNRRGITIDGSEGASIAVVIGGVCGYFMPETDAAAAAAAAAAASLQTQPYLSPPLPTRPQFPPPQFPPTQGAKL